MSEHQPMTRREEVRHALRGCPKALAAMDACEALLDHLEAMRRADSVLYAEVVLFMPEGLREGLEAIASGDYCGVLKHKEVYDGRETTKRNS